MLKTMDVAESQAFEDAPLQVLLVDDVPTNLLLLERMLKGLNVCVIKADSGEAALELAQSGDYALIILDVQMPGLGGIETAQRLRLGANTKDVPIIFVTATIKDQQHEFQGYEAGAVDFLVKPVAPEVLRGKVRVFCRLKEQKAQIEHHLHQLEHEIAERRRAEQASRESEMRYRALSELSPVPVAVLVSGAIRYVNRACLDLLGVDSREEAMGRTNHEFLDEEEWERVDEFNREIAEQAGKTMTLEFVLRWADGRRLQVEARGTNIPYEGALGIQLAMQDITERKRVERELTEFATVDALTAIPNRRYFDATLAHEWARAQRDQRPLSLLLIDIDHFKAYNDNPGHQAGDGCLRRAAEALLGSLHRATDSVARYGGEEFAAILPDTDAAGAAHVAERMRQGILDADIPHETSPVAGRVTISVGSASAVPGPKLRPEHLVRASDRALYEAKASGRNQHCQCACVS